MGDFKDMMVWPSRRQSGKTTYMLGWLRTHPTGVLIVHSTHEAWRLERKNPDLTGRFFTPGMAADGALRGRKDLIIGIDNLDLVLPYLFGGPIGPVTLTEY